MDQQLKSPIVFANEAEYAANQDNYSKQYLLLLVFVDENDREFKDFTTITGRKETYEYLKKYITDRVLDPIQSRVLVKGGTLGQHEISVARFMVSMKSRIFVEDGWEIEDYISLEDIPEDSTLDLIQYDEQNYVGSELIYNGK